MYSIPGPHRPCHPSVISTLIFAIFKHQITVVSIYIAPTLIISLNYNIIISSDIWESFYLSYLSSEMYWLFLAPRLLYINVRISLPNFMGRFAGIPLEAYLISRSLWRLFISLWCWVLLFLNLVPLSELQ